MKETPDFERNFLRQAIKREVKAFNLNMPGLCLTSDIGNVKSDGGVFQKRILLYFVGKNRREN